MRFVENLARKDLKKAKMRNRAPRSRNNFKILHFARTEYEFPTTYILYISYILSPYHWMSSRFVSMRM